MKNFKYLFLAYVISSFLYSCDDTGEKFSGSPQGVLEIVNLQGTVSTVETIVSTNQSFKFVATIPQTFSSDVTVEATTVTFNGSRRKGIAIIPAGSTTGEGSILAPAATGNGSFTQSMRLNLSAISLKNEIIGKQYLLNSNIVEIPLGDSSIPISNSNRCIVRFDWAGPWGESGNPLANNMNMIVKRNGVAYSTVNPATIPPSLANQNTSTTGRYETFSIMNSYPDGDFTFEPFAVSSNVSGFENLPYRFIISFPNDTSKTYSGQYTGLIAPSTPVEKFKIRKLTDPVSSVVNYTYIP